MSYPEPPRRPRYPALAQYEDGYQPRQSFRGTAPARAPWEEETRFQEIVDPVPPSARPERSYVPPERSYPSPERSSQPAERVPDPAERSYAPWEKPTRANVMPGTRLPRDAAGAAESGQAARPDGGERRGRGLLAGGFAGFLAAAVVFGIASLVARFVRPQAAAVTVVDNAFIGRAPSALKNFAIERFGENDKDMLLLLGMYVTLAIIAIVIGMIAWRHLSVGVVGIGLFGVLAAFVAITRPESRTTDVIPSLAGGVAGMIVIVLIVLSGSNRPARDEGL
jgi:hypothetical protein